MNAARHYEFFLNASWVILQRPRSLFGVSSKAQGTPDTAGSAKGTSVQAARSTGKDRSILPPSFHPSRGGSARVASKHARNYDNVLRDPAGSGLPVLLSGKTTVEDTESSWLSGTLVFCVCLGFVLFSLQIQSPSEALPLTEEGCSVIQLKKQITFYRVKQKRKLIQMKYQCTWQIYANHFTAR